MCLRSGTPRTRLEREGTSHRAAAIAPREDRLAALRSCERARSYLERHRVSVESPRLVSLRVHRKYVSSGARFAHGAPHDMSRLMQDAWQPWYKTTDHRHQTVQVCITIGLHSNSLTPFGYSLYEHIIDHDGRRRSYDRRSSHSPSRVDRQDGHVSVDGEQESVLHSRLCIVRILLP
jgi:hypothetical protein